MAILARKLHCRYNQLEKMTMGDILQKQQLANPAPTIVDAS